MGLNFDCSECWSTPCECGASGYIVIYFDGDEMRDKFINLSKLDRESIKKMLLEQLREILQR